MFSHLSTEIHLTFAAIAALLLLANAILVLRRRSVPDRDDTELSLRVRTWWIIVASFAAVLAVSRTTAVVFFAFTSFLAFKEFLSLIPTRRADHRVLFWAYLAIPLQYLWVGTAWFGMFIIFIPVYMFIWLPTRMVLIGETKGFLRAIGTVQWGLMTTVFSLSHAAMLLFIQPGGSARVAAVWADESAKASGGAALLVFLVLLTQFNDVAQFCWGKTVGKRKVIPKVSPGKTVGGLIGGVASTVALAGLVGPWLTFLDLPRSLIAGLIIGVSGFAGDVSISALKRDLGVKDSGSTLPGHGGVLDRVDSLTYTAPLFFHFIYYCYG
ncbi:Phosphatidate cytidylyltransferase [Stieleria maiorica]|uniref:Phosphatidate cytidylyltransferase n=1 Tax=Stieleria maiorica TaxID=2795974 RepID=A0A5B9MHQ1_9BACT|nr:phosphatidate cytidylyltransferase [Stieleria maiorica]QEG00424.1 Phosphatidate cytidylyltransferase [Stieleria maiorica]